MRWFKHLSTSWHDEKLSRLVDEHGLNGYGFWWRLLEIISHQLDEKGKTCCVFSPRMWSKHFGISVKTFRKFSQTLLSLDLICWREWDTLIEISVPNLLKFRDEWTKRKQRGNKHETKLLRCKETDTDIQIPSPLYPPLQPGMPRNVSVVDTSSSITQHPAIEPIDLLETEIHDQPEYFKPKAHTLPLTTAEKVTASDVKNQEPITAQHLEMMSSIDTTYDGQSVMDETYMLCMIDESLSTCQAIAQKHSDDLDCSEPSTPQLTAWMDTIDQGYCEVRDIEDDYTLIQPAEQHLQSQC